MTDHAWRFANLVRLQKAVLCANCEVISEGSNGHCAGCGSQSLLGLSSVLGGMIEPEVSFSVVNSTQTSEEASVYSLAAAA
ncbi:MAG: hypothetical protein WBQ64_20235 [Terriglobales bacterium]